MVQTSPTPFDVGRAFVHQYYTLLHQAPHMLHRFYSTDSTFIHGGVDRPGCVEQPAVGPDNISQRINDLNLRDCHAKIRQVDSHPTIGDGVVVQVTGELSNNGNRMRRFMQTFVLAPRQPKKYYVQNDIFRYQDEVFDEGSDEPDEDDRSSSHIYGDTNSNVDKVSNADSSAAIAATSQQQQQHLLVTANARAPIDEQQPLPPRNAGSSLGNNQQQINPSQVVRQQEQQHAGQPNLNGFSNTGTTESTVYGGIGHPHLQQPQSDSTQAHAQPSPRPINHQATQENQQQSNGGNLTNQQQNKPPPPAQQQQQAPTTEGQRPEGTSYAGITKMHSSAGPTSNVSSTAPVAPRGGPTSSAVPSVPSQQSNTVNAPVKAPLTTANRPNTNIQPGQQQRGNGNYYQQTNRGNAPTAPPDHQVFVGSLPMNFTKENLMEVFGQYGNVVDARIHTSNNETKKNFGFVAFDNPEVARKLIEQEHVIYNDNIRLNIEPKTRGYSANNTGGGNFKNGSQGSGRNNNYPPRGGNRGSYRGSNIRRGGGSGQFNNSGSFSGGDENNNEYRTNKAQT